MFGIITDRIARRTLRDRRRMICNHCEYMEVFMNIKSCGKLLNKQAVKDGVTCGCSIKLKTSLANEHCPLDNPKW